MKHGIVMEIKKGKAIVLTKEGSFEQVALKKNQDVEIGAEIDVPVLGNHRFALTNRPIIFSVAGAVALVLLFLITQFSLSNLGTHTIAAYVSVDINPSFEIGVDESLHIEEVIPLNKDGEQILSKLSSDYKQEPLQEFVNKSIELAEQQGYLRENRDVLLTATVVDEKVSNAVEENINLLKEEIETKGTIVTTLKGDKKARKEANDLGVSTGKYLIVQEAKETLSIEEAKQLSVTQIYEKINEKKEENRNKPDRKNKNPKQDEVPDQPKPSKEAKPSKEKGKATNPKNEKAELLKNEKRNTRDEHPSSNNRKNSRDEKKPKIEKGEEKENNKQKPVKPGKEVKKNNQQSKKEKDDNQKKHQGKQKGNKKDNKKDKQNH